MPRHRASLRRLPPAHNRFWQMHKAIYDNQGQLGPPLLIAIAAQLGLPVPDLEHALANGKYAPAVRSQFVGGIRSGVNATPTFFINNVRHHADFAFNTLARAITDAIIENETRVRTAS